MAHSQRAEDETMQLNLFGGPDQHLRRWIRDLDISSMTPLAALVELNKLKEYLDEKQDGKKSD